MVSLREHLASMEELVPLFQERLAAGQSVRFSPRGVSMMPMLREGTDSVVISPVPEKLRKYDIPLYQRENGKYILHRIVHVGETYICMGDNQFVPEEGIRHSQMIGVVTSFYRGENRWEVTDLRYWCYCRFWHHTRPLRKFYRRATGWLRRHLK